MAAEKNLSFEEAITGIAAVEAEARRPLFYSYPRLFLI